VSELAKKHQFDWPEFNTDTDKVNIGLTVANFGAVAER